MLQPGIKLEGLPRPRLRMNDLNATRISFVTHDPPINVLRKNEQIFFAYFADFLSDLRG